MTRSKTYNAQEQPPVQPGPEQWRPHYAAANSNSLSRIRRPRRSGNGGETSRYAVMNPAATAGRSAAKPKTIILKSL